MWWAELDQVLRSVRKDGELCILLADANARVGSSCSPFVGPEGAEEENPSGFELHQFLATQDLSLPATFESECGGSGTWTWKSPRGFRHRLDYVGVPTDFLSCAVSSGVFEDSLLAIGTHVDHRAASVVVRVPLLAAAAGGT